MPIRPEIGKHLDDDRLGLPDDDVVIGVRPLLIGFEPVSQIHHLDIGDLDLLALDAVERRDAVGGERSAAGLRTRQSRPGSAGHRSQE